MAEIGTAYVNVVPQFDPNVPRIQILELPSVNVGEFYETPFAIIIDGAEEADFDLDALTEFKVAVGAKAIMMSKARIAV